MTDQRTVRLLETWLASEAPVAAPDALLHTIELTTGAVRPRPAWIARLEGHHMDVIEGGRRSTGVPRLQIAVAVIGIVIALVAAVAFIGSRPSTNLVLPSASPGASQSPNPSITPGPTPSPEPTLEPRAAGFGSGGSLTDGRYEHVATILADGRVLITGGSGAHPDHGSNYLTSTEIWDPVTNATTASGSSDPDVDALLRTTEHAILLPDGRVLIVPGGCACRPMPSAPAEIWDPSTGAWQRIDPLTITQTGHSATLLADGRILIAGAGSPPFDGGPASAQAFIWDPVRQTSSPTGSMVTGRGYHAATRLADGRVLVIGGLGATPDDLITSAEVWDPRAGTFTVVPSLAGVPGTPVTLPDGRVLVVGESLAILWDPSDGSAMPAGSLVTPRSGGQTVTLLADGRVLVVGGDRLASQGAPADPVLEAELWDPATLAFEPAGTLPLPRNGHTTTALPDGRAVIVGGAFGDFAGAPLQQIEVWEPARG